MNDEPIAQIIETDTWDAPVTEFRCYAMTYRDYCDLSGPNHHDLIELQTTSQPVRRLAAWVEMDGPTIRGDEYPDYIMAHAIGYAMMLNDSNDIGPLELIDCYTGEVIRTIGA